MCGIAGKIYLDSGEIRIQELTKMSQKIAHRGPDDEGFFISDDHKIGLVNRRLAIIDLSKAAHQPMSYLNRYWITYNGEVYNYQEEKKKLEKKGYKFKSKSDTEVILALYDQYKFNCVKHLRGMFAFAIYDTKENIIFFARDRIGKKPLKYFFNNGVFIFASELKAIITQKEVIKTPNWQDILDYLTYGYVPAPNTGFININKLEPGHFIILDLNKKSFNKVKYWSPDFSKALELPETQWCNDIIRVLDESTKLRLISDVPVGAFLSGGVDSSAVVAMMARNSKKPVKTFTIIFKDKKYSERYYPQSIAKMYKTDHQELLVEPESIEILPFLAYQYEEPYADSSAVISYMISKLAKEYVTVILNGDGGDENFAGYDRYARLKRDVLLDSFLPFTRPLMLPISGLFSKRIHKFLITSKLDYADRFVNYIAFFKNTDKNAILKSSFFNSYLYKDSYEIARKKFLESNAPDKRDRALYFDMTVYFPDDLLAKMDIATMAVGLEARSPLLDYKMIELAAKIPFDLKVKSFGNFKYIFKKALGGIVPNENLYRKKIGFTIPLSTWFTGKLNSYARSILLNKKAIISTFIHKDSVIEMLEKHSEENDFGPKLWNLLTLELWFRSYFT